MNVLQMTEVLATFARFQFQRMNGNLQSFRILAMQVVTAGQVGVSASSVEEDISRGPDQAARVLAGGKSTVAQRADNRLARLEGVDEFEDGGEVGRHGVETG